MKRFSLLILTLAALAACSPKDDAAPAAAQRPMIGASTQALVTSQAHLMGEEPRYGAVSWVRQPDEGEVIVWTLTPGDLTPPVTARIRGERIEAFEQKGALTRKSLAALAAAAGAAPGVHGPTADKVLSVMAIARETGKAASVEEAGATYAVPPRGDSVRVTTKP